MILKLEVLGELEVKETMWRLDGDIEIVDREAIRNIETFLIADVKLAAITMLEDCEYVLVVYINDLDGWERIFQDTFTFRIIEG